MTAPARLAVTDEQGRRTVVLDKPIFRLGRRTSADVRVSGPDTSREHAEIVGEGDRWILRDCGSRFGTFINDEPVTTGRTLNHGDRIQLGRTGNAEIVFLLDADASSDLRAVAGSSTFGQLAAVLNDESGVTPAKPCGFSGSHPCTRCRA